MPEDPQQQPAGTVMKPVEMVRCGCGKTVTQNGLKNHMRFSKVHGGDGGRFGRQHSAAAPAAAAQDSPAATVAPAAQQQQTEPVKPQDGTADSPAARPVARKESVLGALHGIIDYVEAVQVHSEAAQNGVVPAHGLCNDGACQPCFNARQKEREAGMVQAAHDFSHAAQWAGLHVEEQRLTDAVERWLQQGRPAVTQDALASLVGG